jgi:hypothetical protein
VRDGGSRVGEPGYAHRTPYGLVKGMSTLVSRPLLYPDLDEPLNLYDAKQGVAPRAARPIE